jgi:hypothetical protein
MYFSVLFIRLYLISFDKYNSSSFIHSHNSFVSIFAAIRKTFQQMSPFAKKEKSTNMRYNQLGSAGLRVSEVCLGAMTFTLDGKHKM